MEETDDAMDANLKKALKLIEDAAPGAPDKPAKEHCPRRLMGETLPPHGDTGCWHCPDATGSPTSAEARWKVFIPTSDRERMGQELTERITGHLRRLEDDLAAAEQRAQDEAAGAAAMRKAIEEEVLGDAHAEDWPACVSALATDAGRALLERHAAELRAKDEVLTATRLELEAAREIAGEEIEKRKREIEAHAATRAELDSVKRDCSEAWEAKNRACSAWTRAEQERDATRAELEQSRAVQPANWVRREEYDRACAERDQFKYEAEANKRIGIETAKQLRASLARVEEAHAATRYRLTVAEEAAARLETQRNEFRAALANAENTVAALRGIDRERQEVQAALARAEEENARLKTQANRIADERDRNLADKVSARAALANAEATVVTAQEMYADKERRNVELTAKLACAEEENARLRTENDSLSEQIRDNRALDARNEAARAALGRAHVALQRGVKCSVDSSFGPEYTLVKTSEVDAILADADAKAAGEAHQQLIESVGRLYRGQWATNEERDQLIDEVWAVLNGTACVSCGLPGTITCKVCGGECKVDARRGA